MDELLFEILKLIVIIATALVTRYLVPALKRNLELSENKLVKELLNTAVRFAEITFQNSGGGEEKKDFVINYIRQQLSEKHISITEEQLNSLIEAAVYTMNYECSPNVIVEEKKEEVQNE